MNEHMNTAIVPVTGMLVDLNDPVECAVAIADIADVERQLKELRQLLNERLLDESVMQGTKTLHLAEGLTAVVSGGSRTEYDLEALADELRAEGLSEDRLGELIVATVSYRLNGNVARQLRGANPAYAAALEKHRQEMPAPWRVTIERKETTS